MIQEKILILSPNDHHPPQLSLSFFPLARNRLFSTTIEI
jgi:hypothetical protein